MQLTNLETVGLVESRKELVGRKPRTMVSLTNLGKKEIKGYWRTMDQLRSYRVPSMKPQESY